MGGRDNIRPLTLTLTFDLESGVRVTCDVGYLYANFNLPRPLCSRLRPDVRLSICLSDAGIVFKWLNLY